MLDQRRRRWADVVQMLYNFFVFAGLWSKHARTSITLSGNYTHDHADNERIALQIHVR